eukprot:CAMPEP_0118827184 /NCGR_PEP_ID=MMETSP1162-20130426/12469_2 /TAXON_ID=33656 /ORGANISM="Phaeocystis Sp, Strain CCMP2710" /LENGTH=43 /DNA_ID= /DNA_START= /DNA_END= /DNA_ORIENTATION=
MEVFNGEHVGPLAQGLAHRVCVYLGWGRLDEYEEYLLQEGEGA